MLNLTSSAPTSYPLNRLVGVPLDDPRIKKIEEFAEYLDGLIRRQFEQAQDSSGSALAPNLNLGSDTTYLNNIFKVKQALLDPDSQNYPRLDLTQIYIAEQNNQRTPSEQHPQDLLRIIHTESSEFTRKVNEQLPIPIEEKEESEIRTRLIEVFLLKRPDLLMKVTQRLSPEILEEHKEEIWRAISLIDASPKNNPLLYLTQFKEAMETLPVDLRKALVNIIYENPDLSSKPYEYYSSITSSPLRFKEWYDVREGHDLSNYYLRDIDFTKIRFDNGSVGFPFTNMSGIDLTKSNFNKLDLGYANLNTANLTDTNFSNANLSGANLSGANLTRTNFSGAQLVGTQLGDAYWEEGHPPAIDYKTRFIYDSLADVGMNLFPLGKLKQLLKSKKILCDHTEKIQNAFEGVSPEMKQHILNNIGLFQRRALEAILAYKDPNKKFTATDARLILPEQPASITMPDEQAANLEAGFSAASLIETETPITQSVNYNLTLIDQQANLKNVTRVSGDHTRKDFSSPEISFFGASFDQAILDLANLSRKDLSEAVFNECRLIKTDLSGTKLQNTIFNNCDLSEVDLSKAKMKGTTFHNCNLSKSTWEKALMDGVSMINCTIKDVDIKEMTSHNWFLDHCILENVNFKGSEDKGIFINQMGLISSIIVNSNIEGNTNFYNVEAIGSVLAMNDPEKKLLNEDLSSSPLSYINNSPIQIALEAVFQQGSIYSKALQDVKDNGVNFGPVDLMDLSGLSQAAIGYQPQRFAKIDPKLLKSMG